MKMMIKKKKKYKKRTVNGGKIIKKKSAHTNFSSIELPSNAYMYTGNKIKFVKIEKRKFFV
jgi:hypothetical protein